MKTVFFDTVFFDIDTQIDFLYPSGALYVPGAERIVDRLSALNRYAADHNILVISTMDAHSENDPEFKAWPHHCVVDTVGQAKPASTLLEKRLTIPNRPLDLQAEQLSGVQQLLLEKQTFDCFTNVNLAGILAQINADRYVVYGVVTEICVQMAAAGLLKTGKRVELVTDAVRSLSDAASQQMTQKFCAQSGILTTVAATCAQENP
jgi:nicotinamidase/pyrazinamidase